MEVPPVRSTAGATMSRPGDRPDPRGRLAPCCVG
jgi:hypothetical protein